MYCTVFQRLSFRNMFKYLYQLYQFKFFIFSFQTSFVQRPFKMELKCAVQNYHWGKVGSASLVASFAANAVTDFKLDEGSNYAELWMGTHNSGPSVIKETGETLPEYIKKNPDCLGEKVLERFGGELPFLFKVLSVRQALSIQIHPNKSNAEALNAKFPDRYKDSNHKPEIAIALTDFQGLCGFRPLKEIQDFLQKLPELQTILGEASTQALLNAKEDDYKDGLKASFTSLMKVEVDVLKKELEKLAARINDSEGLQKDLFNTLNKDFPGDVGCFAIFFLNHVKLLPGRD